MLLWVGCIAGALEEKDYRAKLVAAGFSRRRPSNPLASTTSKTPATSSPRPASTSTPSPRRSKASSSAPSSAPPNPCRLLRTRLLLAGSANSAKTPRTLRQSLCLCSPILRKASPCPTTSSSSAPATPRAPSWPKPSSTTRRRANSPPTARAAIPPARSAPEALAQLAAAGSAHRRPAQQVLGRVRRPRRPAHGLRLHRLRQRRQRALPLLARPAHDRPLGHPRSRRRHRHARRDRPRLPRRLHHPRPPHQPLPCAAPRHAPAALAPERTQQIGKA